MRPAAAIPLSALLFVACTMSPGRAGEAPAAGALTLKVGDEVLVMADGPGKTMRSFPAVGFGSNLFLVAWQEGWQGKGGRSRIYVARVRLDGEPLDPKGIELAPCETGVQEYPRVAFSGGVFLVVWQDMRNGKDCDVLAARVSPEGKVLDPQPIAIAAGPRTQAMPDVAADDKGFIVVWHGFQGEEVFPKVFAARVGADGSRGEPVAVTDGAAPRIAWNAKEHLVIYTAGRAKHWLRMDTDGKALWNPKPRSSSDSIEGDPFCSTCGLSPDAGWLIVCHGGEPNWWYRSLAIQRAARITPEGKKETPGDTSGTYAPKGGVPPENWLDTSFGKKTQPNVGGSANTPSVFPYGGSALASDGRCCVVVWQRYHMGGASNMEMVNGDLLASRLDGWKPLDKEGVPVAASAAEETSPALAGNGAGRLLCVYEKVEDGRTWIVVRTLQTR
ncbi:MAG: hypothetical protein FJ290_21665 [Planctomycetes bacterium]|nr:hypothetical protein [Planctomycetota bacterium]